MRVDSMSISQRSVIEVQNRGIKLEEMEYKVFGLVPFTWREKHATENAVTHLRSFLYEGTGLDGLLRIIYGLKEAMSSLLLARTRFATFWNTIEQRHLVSTG